MKTKRWVIRDEKTKKVIASESLSKFKDVSEVIEEYSSLADHFTVKEE